MRLAGATFLLLMLVLPLHLFETEAKPGGHPEEHRDATTTIKLGASSSSSSLLACEGVLCPAGCCIMPDWICCDNDKDCAADHSACPTRSE